MKIYTVDEIDNQRFYMVPKALFHNPRYAGNNEKQIKPLSPEAKMVYAMLKDRMELSRENNWINEKGQIYLKYKRSELMDILDCSKTTIAKIMKELAFFELIYEKRLGLKRTNEIYICHVEYAPVEASKSAEVQKMDFRKSRKSTSGSPENGRINDTDLNDTDSKETTTIHEDNVVVVSSVKSNIEDLDEQKILIDELVAVNVKVSTAVKFVSQNDNDKVKYLIALFKKQKNVKSPGAWFTAAFKEDFVDVEVVQAEVKKIKQIEVNKIAEESAKKYEAEQAAIDEPLHNPLFQQKLLAGPGRVEKLAKLTSMAMSNMV